MAEGSAMDQLARWLVTPLEMLPWVGFLLLMMLLDLISGLMSAWYSGQLCSKTGWRGMMRKTGIVLVIGVSFLLELAVKHLLPESVAGSVSLPFASLTASFFFLIESISVLENCKKMGVPMPEFLTRGLRSAADKVSGDSVHLQIDKASVNVKVEHQSEVK